MLYNYSLKNFYMFSMTKLDIGLKPGHLEAFKNRFEMLLEKCKKFMLEVRTKKGLSN